MISNATFVCATSESRQFFNDASSLRAGTMTETAGGSVGVGVAGIGRIYYYSGVQPMICSVRAVKPALRMPALMRNRSGLARPHSRGRLSPSELSSKTAALRLIALVLVLLMSACYSGSRPPRIGTAAPDFTVRDSAGSVTLSQLKGRWWC